MHGLIAQRPPVGLGEQVHEHVVRVAFAEFIGRSTHTPTQFDAAAAEPGVDYLCAGPIWATPTKPARPEAGLSLLAHASTQTLQRPWFAIGGIENLDRLDQVIARGARRVVLVRAITTATDPAAATQAISNRLRR